MRSPGINDGYRRLVTTTTLQLVYGELDTSSIVDAMWYQPSPPLRFIIIKKHHFQSPLTSHQESPIIRGTACANRLRRCVKYLRIVKMSIAHSTPAPHRVVFCDMFRFVLAPGGRNVAVLLLLGVPWQSGSQACPRALQDG